MYRNGITCSVSRPRVTWLVANEHLSGDSAERGAPDRSAAATDEQERVGRPHGRRTHGAPALSEDWHEILDDSCRRCREDFAVNDAV